jgi:tetratricopeptide (TPR) repeat protein
LWDSDTLEMERQRFPGILELITGKFLHHSEGYDRWRIEDRQIRLLSEAVPELYDDLAVAYDKLGEQEKAIETATECEQIFPGRYETAANLGTFHIHAGNFGKGLEFIALALKINPDAHFGRERYQKLLVEYLLTKRTEGHLNYPLEPAWPEEKYYAHHLRGFAKYCEEDNADSAQVLDDKESIAKALRGVQGMMKFGQHDSPVLLEALGDLLLAGHRDIDTKRLAARAYLRAAESRIDTDEAAVYRELAAKALEIHVAHDVVGIPPIMTVEELERRLKAEVRDAK